jgi:allantoinase
LLRSSAQQDQSQEETAVHPRERLAFQPIEGRPPLKFPDGIRLVVWPVFSLEDWDL